MSTHTPTPWNANNIKDDPNDLACAVWSADGNTPICTTRFSVGKYNEVDPQTQHANAAFIVRAVNSHAQLLEALKLTLRELGEFQNFMQTDSYSAIKAAIAHAEGKES